MLMGRLAHVEGWVGWERCGRLSEYGPDSKNFPRSRFQANTPISKPYMLMASHNAPLIPGQSTESINRILDFQTFPSFANDGAPPLVFLVYLGILVHPPSIACMPLIPSASRKTCVFHPGWDDLCLELRVLSCCHIYCLGFSAL